MLPMARRPHSEGKHLTNLAKSVIRVIRSESGPCTSLVGHPDGDNASDYSRDDIDGAMRVKAFQSQFIVLLRSSLGMSRRYKSRGGAPLTLFELIYSTQ